MISFIIPAYNAEKFIKRCLDSILSQTVLDFEIIVINDGSTDNTKKILDEYKLNHNLLIVKTIENQGHGNARNYGVSLATNDYIWFVDADDYLYDNESVSRVIENINNFKPDIHIFSAFETNFKDRNKVWNFTKKDVLLKNKNEFRKLAFDQQWSWNRVIRRKFLVDTGVKYNNYRMFEDIYFIIELYKNADSIYISRDINYVYVKHDEALTSSKKNFVNYPKALLRELRFFLTTK